MMLRSRDVPRPRIVVVDDDADTRDLVALMLGHCGFDVLGVADGEAVITSILSEGADGVVSDLQMRGLDGLALCRVLRALRASVALPIVVFTGVAEDDARVVALRDINDVEVLHKPLGLREIAPVLTAMLPMKATRFGVTPKMRRVLGEVRGDPVWPDALDAENELRQLVTRSAAHAIAEAASAVDAGRMPSAASKTAI